eukprot:6468475-Amphidinium_carterae.1
MMWKKQYVEFRESAKGGKYSEEEALRSWDEMYQRYCNKDPELEYDMEGPRADQPLRFNINVG